MGVNAVNDAGSAYGAAFRNKPIFFMTGKETEAFFDGKLRKNMELLEEAFSVADSGFAVDMGALDGRVTPRSSGNMYSDMYRYQFKKVL